MKELYAKYGDTIFVDSTYKLNRNKYPCLVIAVHDNNNCTHIVATAILAYERKHLLDQVIDVFVTDNSAYVKKTKHIMIDKDLKEDDVLQLKFPDANLYYCYFHVQKIFDRNFKSDVTEYATKIMLSDNEKEFNEHLQKFNSIATVTNKLYFTENWLNCTVLFLFYLLT